MPNLENEIVKEMAEEIVRAIRKINEQNNRNYVDNQLKNFRSSSSSTASKFTGSITSSQVSDFYDALTGYLVNAPGNAAAGDENAGRIVTTLTGIAAIEVENATIHTAQIENLYGSYAEFINLVAQNATIGDLDVGKVRADIAEMGLANIGSADIGWAQIKDLVTNTAIIREGVGGKLYIDRLAVTDAQILSLTTGELVLQGSDGNLYTVYVNEEGVVQTERRMMSGSDVAEGTITGDNIQENTITGALITEHAITARELNVSQIFADEALIEAIKAANLDVGDLFANSGFISQLETNIIQSPTIGEELDVSNNSSITMLNDRISLIVTSESSESKLILTDAMLQAIADKINLMASEIDLSANTSIKISVQNIEGLNPIIIQSIAPENPEVDTLWMDISLTPNQLKRWDGEQWITINDPQSIVDSVFDAQINLDGKTGTIAMLAKQVSSTVTDLEGIETRVLEAEQKITPEAITQTLFSSEQYMDAMGNIDERIIAAESKITPEAITDVVVNSDSFTSVQQNARKIEWLVQSGTSKTDMVLTDELLDIVSKNVKISAESINAIADQIDLSANHTITFNTSQLRAIADNIDLSSNHTITFNADQLKAIADSIDLSANRSIMLMVGDAVKSVDVEYYLSNSSTGLVGGEWKTTVPTISQGKYVWQRVKTVSGNKTSYSEEICLTSTADQGPPGRGITSVKEQYYLSTSKESPVDGTWQDNQPAWEENHYIWTRTVVTYDDGDIEYYQFLADALNSANQSASDAQSTASQLTAERFTYLRIVNENDGSGDEAGVYIGLLKNGQRPELEAFISASGSFEVRYDGVPTATLGKYRQTIGNLVFWQTSTGSTAIARDT